MSDPRISLIVATRGRADPFALLFASLERQTCRAFDVIIVDQNPDERAGNQARAGWSFPIQHLRTPTEAGTSRARNRGLAHASAPFILFPDDDCWYPPHFLDHALARIEALGADVLTGRASDEAGRDINGRFETRVVRIDRANVFTTGIEWVMVFKRAVLDALGGFNPEIGVGASTPWQACEAQDILLRALDRGFACTFDPSVTGRHAELDITDPSMLRKGRAYARGLGFVLRHHHYPATTAANWIARPLVLAALSLARGDAKLFAYYRNVALGRFEGWRMTIVGGAPSPKVATRQVSARG